MAIKKELIHCIYCKRPMLIWIENGEITGIQETSEETYKEEM